MHRTAIAYLEKDWLVSPQRKPLIIRGARQVGKTWLVRHLAASSKRQLIELNFEKQPQLASLFTTNDINQILVNLSVVVNEKIDPQKCLLFLDEIQAAPEVLSKLRWFSEDLPQLPIIATGSLLEFVLESHTFSMPVGRITYMHLEPLSFEEFLLARDKSLLCDYINNFQYDGEIPIYIHDELTSMFKEFIIIGGMPAAISNWVEEQSLFRVSQIHHDLLATYRDDFAKYSGRITLDKLDEVMMSIPKNLCKKFVYSNVNPSFNTNTVKQVLLLLNKARICHRVSSASANGIPLGAEIKEKYFKEIFLDTGLCSAALGLSYSQVKDVHEISYINKGEIAEQVAGQLLRTIEPFYIEPSLYYWQRDEKGSSAEVDYLIQHGNKIIPIEVKAGSSGTLKSLHLLMESKKLDTAIRIHSNRATITKVEHKNRDKKLIKYKLISIPFYLMGQIHRLLDLS